MVGEPISAPRSVDDADVLLVDFDGGTDGHRGQYNAMLAELFRLRPARFGLASLVSPRPILAPQIEHAPVRFLIACLVRAVQGRRTVGLLLRPLPALYGTSLRLRAKRTALQLLRRLRNVWVLTIVPFAVEPGFERIARGWIHDLQNWDFALGSSVDQKASDQLAATVRSAAAGRKVCVAIGGQNRSKGFDRFAACWLDQAMQGDFLFAYGGRVTADLRDAAARFAAAGGFALDRYVTDSEILGLYRAADLVWCAYDPDYDQASGVLGRAMQFGIPVVARRGSVIERLCDLAGHPCVTARGDGLPFRATDVPDAQSIELSRERARQQARFSLAVLSDALGATPRRTAFPAEAS